MTTQRYRDAQGRFVSREEYYKYSDGTPVRSVQPRLAGTRPVMMYGRDLRDFWPSARAVEYDYDRMVWVIDQADGRDPVRIGETALTDLIRKSDARRYAQANGRWDERVRAVGANPIAPPRVVQDGPDHPPRKVDPDIRPLGSTKFGFQPPKPFRSVTRISEYPNCCGASSITNFYSHDTRHDHKKDIETTLKKITHRGIVIAIMNQGQKDAGWGQAMLDNGFQLTGYASNPSHDNASTIYHYQLLTKQATRKVSYVSVHSDVNKEGTETG